MKYDNFIPRAVFGLGLLLAVFMINPAHAGGAATLVPAQDADVPQGSQISDRRIKEMQRKVEAYKANMREKHIDQPQDQLPQNELSEPEAADPGKS